MTCFLFFGKIGKKQIPACFFLFFLYYLASHYYDFWVNIYINYLT